MVVNVIPRYQIAGRVGRFTLDDVYFRKSRRPGKYVARPMPNTKWPGSPFSNGRNRFPFVRCPFAFPPDFWALSKRFGRLDEHRTRRIVFAGANSVFHRFAPVPRIFIYVFPSAYSVYNQRTVSVFLFVRVFRARPRRPRPLSLASFPDRLADTSPLCRSASHLPCDPFDLGIPNPCPRRSIRFVERLSIFVVRVKTSTRRVPVT